MRHGDPLRYWDWYSKDYLRLKAGVVPMAVNVYFSPSRRVFTKIPATYTHHQVYPERIEPLAVTEALAVSLTYVEGK